MIKIKKGDIVTRTSYNNDIVFLIENIIETKDNSPIAILKGITVRIEASAYIEDLQLVDKKRVSKEVEQFKNSINTRANKILEEFNIKKHSRKYSSSSQAVILHLDGDSKYAMQSSKIYSTLQLNAIVKNVREDRQPSEITYLLNKYRPDIVVITGHDGMIKKGYKYNDISNYRNSKYFVRTVQEARRWEQGDNRMAIFAGACQSYYEAIMEAGANFASSPARILIDFMDPLMIAQKIAITPKYKYITIQDMVDDLKDGERGVSGIGCFGKLDRYLM